MCAQGAMVTLQSCVYTDKRVSFVMAISAFKPRSFQAFQNACDQCSERSEAHYMLQMETKLLMLCHAQTHRHKDTHTNTQCLAQASLSQ